MVRILVADDEQDLAWAIRRALCNEGYEVLCAYNGAEPLQSRLLRLAPPHGAPLALSVDDKTVIQEQRFFTFFSTSYRILKVPLVSPLQPTTQPGTSCRGLSAAAGQALQSAQPPLVVTPRTAQPKQQSVT